MLYQLISQVEKIATMQELSSSDKGSSETRFSDRDLSDQTFPSRPKGPPTEQADAAYPYHLSLLRPSSEQLQRQQQEVINTPVFTLPALGRGSKYVLENSKSLFPQYGLLAGMSDVLNEKLIEGSDTPHYPQDPRVFFNVI